jgi:hypothetical protein
MAEQTARLISSADGLSSDAAEITFLQFPLLLIAGILIDKNAPVRGGVIQMMPFGERQVIAGHLEGKLILL